ncbi:MAG: lipocalin family protein [Acidobacteriia bacterium]|nr:lipocalin family protein [Terriglobia bacterium]
MRTRSCWLVLVFLVFGSGVFAQQSSLVGTWVGKVQGYGVEMKLVLNADGSADYEGVLGKWRLQGGKLLLTEEGETVAYNFTLQGSQLTLSGGDLMAPMVMTRAGGGAARGRTPSAPEAERRYEAAPPAQEPAPARRAPARPSTRGLSEAELARPTN